MRQLFNLNIAGIVAVAMTIAATAVRSEAADAPRPNVVVIVADDK